MSAATQVAMPEVDRAAASRAAVAIRRDRAALKAALRSGARTHRDVLVEAMRGDDEVAASLRVTDFLLTLPFVGSAKLGRILEQLAISDRKRLGGLGRQQASSLWEFLGQWLARHPVRGAGEIDL